jgi:hypothetical protein
MKCDYTTEIFKFSLFFRNITSIFARILTPQYSKIADPYFLVVPNFK